MYVASVFNARGLFQHLNGWVAQADGDARQRREAKVQEVYFRATCVLVAVDRMMQLGEACVREYAEFESEVDVKDARVVFWSPRLVGILNELPSALMALRIMQNALLPAFASGLENPVSVPQSMHDAVKRSHKVALPNELKNRVLSYWFGGGKRLKEYRDVDQHYAALVRHTFLQVGEPRRVSIFLPDNPEARKGEDSTFLEELDAFDFACGSFDKLHILYEDLATMQGAVPTPLRQVVGVGQLGELEEGVSKTLAVIVDGTPADQATIVGQTEDRRMTARQAFRSGDATASAANGS